MNCRAVKKNLSALLDGELSERERALYLSHLKHCSECRTIYEQLLLLHEAAAVPEELPAGLEERIFRSVLRDGEPARPTRRRRLWPATVALGAAMGLVLCFWAVRGLPAGSEMTPEAQRTGMAEASLFSQEDAVREKNAAPFADMAGQAERELTGEYDRVYSVELETDESLKPAEDAGFVLELTVEDRNYLVGDASLISQLPYRGFAGAGEQLPGECLLVLITEE